MGKLPREGSRKAAIYHHFTLKGEDAAIKLGDELRLSASTVRSWIGSWRKQGVLTQEHVIDPSRRDKPIHGWDGKGARWQSKQRGDGAGRRVYKVYAPEIYGTVIREGPEVSEVKWDPPHPWGNDCYVANKHLRDVEEEPTKSKRGK
jgi:hypothetical protein